MPYKDYVTVTKPSRSKDIVGNNSLIQELKQDLELKTSKAIFISGPCGLGKTLCLQLISKELDLDTIWHDAADLDSKKILSLDLMGENVESLFFHKDDSREKVFIIDNADSFPESVNKSLIEKIKTIKNRLIIVCNDPYPLKDLEKYCTSFKFIRPSKIQIKNFLFSKGIFKETKDLVKNEKIHAKIEELITETNNDIRFLLNTLSLKITKNDKDKTFNNIFDATSIIFDATQKLYRKLDAFYFDTFLVPLMIHENYIQKNSKQTLDTYSSSADDLSQADIYNKSMFTETNGYQGIMIIRVTSRHRIAFPSFTKLLGHESSTNSRKTQLKSLGINRLDVYTCLILIITKKIISREYQEVIDIFKKVGIQKDQFYDFLLTLWLGSEKPDPILSKDKAAFTRYITSLKKKS